MSLLLALCLMADAGVPPEGGIELVVYRSARELPAAWAASLPKDFDFRKQMLGSRAQPTVPVEVIAPWRVERHGEAIHLWASPLAAEPEMVCPPCRGVAAPWDHLRLVRPAERFPPSSLFVLPRAPGKVFLHPLLEVPLAIGPNGPRCEACTAP